MSEERRLVLQQKVVAATGSIVTRPTLSDHNIQSLFDLHQTAYA
jgi:hypothetical protein